MSNLSDRHAYLCGLAEGLGVDISSNEGKLIAKLIELLGDVVTELDDLRDEVRELDEYVESIDDDMAEFFSDFDDDEDDGDDDEYFFDDDDEDDDEDVDDEDARSFSFSYKPSDFLRDLSSNFVSSADADDGDEDDEMASVCMACICPECNEMFGVEASAHDNDALFTCPHCKKIVPAIAISDGDMPVAKVFRDGEDGEK